MRATRACMRAGLQVDAQLTSCNSSPATRTCHRPPPLSGMGPWPGRDMLVAAPRPLLPSLPVRERGRAVQAVALPAAPIMITSSSQAHVLEGQGRPHLPRGVTVDVVVGSQSPASERGTRHGTAGREHAALLVRYTYGGCRHHAAH